MYSNSHWWLGVQLGSNHDGRAQYPYALFTMMTLVGITAWQAHCGRCLGSSKEKKRLIMLASSAQSISENTETARGLSNGVWEGQTVSAINTYAEPQHFKLCKI